MTTHCTPNSGRVGVVVYSVVGVFGGAGFVGSVGVAGIDYQAMLEVLSW
jgi:hypothetical protein